MEKKKKSKFEVFTSAYLIHIILIIVFIILIFIRYLILVQNGQAESIKNLKELYIKERLNKNTLSIDSITSNMKEADI